MFLKTKTLILVLFLIPFGFRAQLVLNGAIRLVMNGGTAANGSYFVLNNPPAPPITTIGGGYGTILEGEYNILKYNLGVLTTSITVPYMTTGLESFPLTMRGIGGATGAGSIQFSAVVPGTRATGWDNLSYKPSDVVNMTGPVLADNSPYSIDRFWIIDPVGYTAKPSVTLDFTYLNAEEAINGGNSITPANLQAQRWNSSLTPASWVDYYPQGTSATGGTSGTVTSVVVPAADFFRSWTLNDNSQPLPIQLLNFAGQCENGHVNLNWQTASETNSSHFTVQKSYDGMHFFSIGDIPASGNSSGIRNYSFSHDSVLHQTAYYRLLEVDLNGETSQFTIQAVNPCKQVDESLSAYQSGEGQISILFYSLSGKALPVKVYDSRGRLVAADQFNAGTGFNHFELNVPLASGIYLVVLENEGRPQVCKIGVRQN